LISAVDGELEDAFAFLESVEPGGEDRGTESDSLVQPVESTLLALFIVLKQ